MEHRDFESEEKTVAEVQDFIKKKTKIDFKISESTLEGGSIPFTKGINKLRKKVPKQL